MSSSPAELGDDAVEDAAPPLLRFAAEVDTGRHGDPAFPGVITCTECAYRRNDGVPVITIGCLAP